MSARSPQKVQRRVKWTSTKCVIYMPFNMRLLLISLFMMGTIVLPADFAGKRIHSHILRFDSFILSARRVTMKTDKRSDDDILLLLSFLNYDVDIKLTHK